MKKSKTYQDVETFFDKKNQKGRVTKLKKMLKINQRQPLKIIPLKL